MNLSEWERCCFWRALEASDAMEAVLPEAAEAEATLASRGDLSSQGIAPDALSAEAEAFLVRRARRLDGLAAEAMSGGAAAWLGRARLPRLPGWLRGAVWAAAAVAGFAMTTLGNERELNLLALPLVGLLAWNAVVMIGVLVLEFLPGRRHDASKWSRRLQPAQEGKEGRFLEAYETLTGEMGRRVLARRVRTLLHVGAALMAAGSMLALFARGWSVEYRAVWESTILDADGARRFLGGLFAPASVVFGPEVPLADIAGMRRGAGLQTQPSDALPWLQLYAGTLALGVVVPRLLLALLSSSRMRGELSQRIARQGWPGYAIRTLRRVEGTGSSLLVVAAGSRIDESATQRWREWLGQLFGGRCDFQLQAVDESGQDDWVDQWQPADGRVVAVFFLAATPEDEVQRAWLARMREKLLTAHFEPELSVLLDAAGLAGRWPAEKRRSREQLWREAVSGLASAAWVGDEGGLTDLRGDTPQKPL